MKSDLSKWILTFIFFVVLACIIFRGVFPEHMVFSASDLNIGRLAEKKYALPELLTGCFSANQVMGSSGYEFSLFNILLLIFPLTFLQLYLSTNSCNWILAMVFKNLGEMLDSINNRAIISFGLIQYY